MSMDTNKEAPGIDRERIPETITFRTADRMTYEACADALSQVFYDALMEQLLCNEKAGFVKPPGHKPATLSEKEGRNDVRQDSEHAG